MPCQTKVRTLNESKLPPSVLLNHQYPYYSYQMWFPNQFWIRINSPYISHHIELKKVPHTPLTRRRVHFFEFPPKKWASTTCHQCGTIHTLLEGYTTYFDYVSKTSFPLAPLLSIISLCASDAWSNEYSCPITGLRNPALSPAAIAAVISCFSS